MRGDDKSAVTGRRRGSETGGPPRRSVSGFPRPSARSPRRAFTLLEILVAVAITALIGVLIVQLISATTTATQQSNRGIDAASQARLAFDRLNLDLSARVRRMDVDLTASPDLAAGSAPLLFFSEVTSAGIPSADNRGVSLVGYRIGTSPETPRRCLLRAGAPLSWSQAGFIGTSTNGLPTPLSSAPVALADADFDALAPAVIHAAMGFQLYPDGQPATLQNGSQVTSCRGQIVYSPPVRRDASGQPTALVDPSRIAALIVGVVAMDPRTMERLTDSQVGALAAAFSLPDDGILPMAKWGPIADNASGLDPSVPLSARQSLRVFQRAFPITPFTPR